MPPGDFSGVVPPVPISNTEVKLSSADDTARATVCGKYVIARGLNTLNRVIYYTRTISVRGGAVVARRAHNPKVVGSNPTPATKDLKA